MSDNFPNNPSDSNLPDIGMSDPNNSALDMDDANLPSTGKTKVVPTDLSGPESQVAGYGYMSPDLKDVGTAPSGENSSGIPAAQPIDPITYGDPNQSSIDAKNNHSVNTPDETTHGFKGSH